MSRVTTETDTQAPHCAGSLRTVCLSQFISVIYVHSSQGYTTYDSNYWRASQNSAAHLLDIDFTLLQCISFSLRDNWPTEITLKRIHCVKCNFILYIYIFYINSTLCPPNDQIDRMQRQPAATRRGHDVIPIFLLPSRPG